MEPSPEDVILEEEIDPNYEPTEEELLEYATWLGMDLTNHKNMLWIAKEALIAPLPSDWKPCLTEEDEIYYFNFTTGHSIWDHPCDEHYRQVYKEEVKKLNKVQQNNQTTAGSSPSLKDPRALVVQSNSKSSQRGSVGDSSSQNSMDTVSARDLTVGSRSFDSPSFPRVPSSSSNNNHLTRSLPPPQVVGHPAVLKLKGGSFDSMLRLYAARLAKTGGSMPLADFLKMQGSLLTKTNDNSTSCGDDRKAFEMKISQIKERIEKKLVDEERIVLQQERVEMLERVCKQVQEEESHVLDSLRREIMERMERNIREETQALLAKRRKEIADEVESEIQAEKLRLVESRQSQKQSGRSNPLDDDTSAMISMDVPKVEGKGPSSGKKEMSRSEWDNMMSAQRGKRDEGGPLKLTKENEDFSMDQNVHRGSQDMQIPVRIAPRLHTEQDDEGEGKTKSSLQKVEAEEKKFEKSFHVQDSRTSLMLKLEVSLKVGTSND